MLRYLKTRKAQVIMSEYVLVFFLVMGMIAAMTIYFKRAVQARMFDARNTMMNEVYKGTRDYYNTVVLQTEYEPYYSNTASRVVRQQDAQTNLLSGGSSGIFRKTTDETTTIQSQSQTAAPREAN